jgi:hypothetical protein
VRIGEDLDVHPVFLVFSRVPSRMTYAFALTAVTVSARVGARVARTSTASAM